MKPPSRRRLLPLRFWDSKKSEPKKGLCTRWRRQELENLLYALRQQALHSELDYLELRKKVPKLSLLELQKMIKLLKSRVGQQVCMKVRKQRREEQKTKVPIQIWAELAQRMAGDHEEAISSAFSQMLVIAATEPCSLLHSDPPRSTDTPDLLANNLQTIQMKPMSHCGSEPPSTPPPVMILPGRTRKTPARSRKVNEVSSSSAQTSTIMSPLLQSSLISSAKANSVESQSSVTSKNSAKLSIPCTPKSVPDCTSSQSQLASKSTPPVPTSSAASTTTVSLPSQSNQLPNGPERRQSLHDWQSKSVWTRHTVDFEKIYRFMSDSNGKNCSSTLTAMESAVLLDLLMALPEEIPLLDCKELQHHLLHVQTHLNTPKKKKTITAVANPDSTEVTDEQTSRDDQHGNNTYVTHDKQTAMDSSVQNEPEPIRTTELLLEPGHINDQTPGSVLSDKGDWAAAGMCPLNPFMIPVVLLKQQESQESADQH